jgi:hypothetical protein
MNIECPKCKSTEFTKLSLVYAAGFSDIETRSRVGPFIWKRRRGRCVRELQNQRRNSNPAFSESFAPAQMVLLENRVRRPDWAPGPAIHPWLRRLVPAYGRELQRSARVVRLQLPGCHPTNSAPCFPVQLHGVSEALPRLEPLVYVPSMWSNPGTVAAREEWIRRPHPEGIALIRVAALTTNEI